MIKIKMCELDNIIKSLEQFIEMIKDRNIPFKYSYLFTKLIMKLNEEYIIFNQERQRILNKYCDKDENGNIKTIKKDETHIEIIFKHEFAEEGKEKVSEMLNHEIEIDFKPINIEQFVEEYKKINNGSDMPFSLIDMIHMNKFFDIFFEI